MCSYCIQKQPCLLCRLRQFDLEIAWEVGSPNKGPTFHRDLVWLCSWVVFGLRSSLELCYNCKELFFMPVPNMLHIKIHYCQVYEWEIFTWNIVPRRSMMQTLSLVLSLESSFATHSKPLEEGYLWCGQSLCEGILSFLVIYKWLLNHAIKIPDLPKIHTCKTTMKHRIQSQERANKKEVRVQAHLPLNLVDHDSISTIESGQRSSLKLPIALQAKPDHPLAS